jgi:hypothetical protein
MTTITTAKLRYIAHTLGTTPERLQPVIRARFCATIDDTPADTEEQTMAMTTIMQEQVFAGADHHRIDRHDALKLVASLGITITPAEPPAGMVKLAREIANNVNDVDPVFAAALAALQHAVDVVRNAPVDGSAAPWHVTASITHILTALGAGGRDALKL